MKFTIVADKLFDGYMFHDHLPITVEDGYISEIGAENTTNKKQLKGMIAPGFIDVQVNGGGGYLFNDDPGLETIDKMITAHAKFGTTALLPTLISDNIDVMERSADAVSSGIKDNFPGLLGVHFEGPHLSKEKRGVHQEKYFRDISERELQLYSRDDIGVKKVTLAPECVPADVIELLTGLGVLVSLGHSLADYDTVVDALNKGASCFTHLYNAMSPISARNPSMVGAALTHEDSWCGLILDGHHVHPALAKLATDTKPSGKIILVTDAMSTVGTDLEEFNLLGERIIVKNGRLIASEGQLAGSALDMATAVRNSVKMLGVPIEDALKMASVYPAEFLGISEFTGTLEIGKRADFILLDDDLMVKSTWIHGTQVFACDKEKD